MPQRRNSAVMRCFCAAIIRLGRRGQDFEQRRWAQQRIALVIRQARRSAGDNGVRVRVHASIGNMDAHVVRIDLAPPPFELQTQFADDVCDNQVMRTACARHVEHLAVDKFVFCLAASL